MKKLITIIILAFLATACSQSAKETGSTAAETDITGPAQAANKGQASTDSGNNVLNIAANSPDHTTLVAAVQAAGIEHILANNGPFTVFAPTNDAFAALPEGTVEGLLKPEAKADLINILYYHAAPVIYKDDLLSDGRQIYMANGDNTIVKVTEDGIFINDAKILGTVDGTNGVVHVVDKVLLPQ